MKKLLLVVCVALAACQQDDILTPLTSDQVERLLLDDGTKTWLMTGLTIDGERQSFDACRDTVRWLFTTVKADSIVGYELKFEPTCSAFDTTFLGEMTVSNFNGTFSDSLNFSGGTKTYIKPTFLRSSTIDLSYMEGGKAISASFSKSKSDLLARQVGYYLSNGATAGSSQKWLLTGRTINNARQTIATCADSLFFEFSRDEAQALLLNQLTPTPDCSGLSSLLLGKVSIPSTDGYFENTFSLSDGVVTDMEVTSFTYKSFVIKYSIYSSDTTSYSVTGKKI